MATYYDEITGEYVDDGSDYDYGYDQLDDTSGTYSFDGWDYTDGIWTDPEGESYDMSYLDPAEQSTISSVLSKLGSSALNALKKAYTKPDGSIDWKTVAATAGGLYGLSQTKTPQPTGYQGGIPKYEAVREKVPNTYDPNRRPGSGGQQYFTDVKYAKEDEAVAARAAAKEEALGLESLNKANPAQQSRPTAAAVAQADESAAIQEGRPASDVIEDRPVPTYAHGGITALAQGGMGKSAPRYLNGATDGMGDKIPARIDDGQEARLSHGEFVIPADIVGHLGNGNSEAGAERLYAMMDKIRKARTGTTKQGKQINPDKFLA